MNGKEEILAAIETVLGGTRQGTKLVGVRCPFCCEAEGYVFADNPHVIHCPRANKCGVGRTRTRAVEALAHLYQDWVRRHPPTQADPHATARAWLSRMRGLDLALLEQRLGTGFWHQATWTDKKGAFQGLTQDTVCFRFGERAQFQNHRLLEPPVGCAKMRNWPAYKGHVWAPPEFSLAGEVWVCEGVIDALSLIQAGQTAVATISSGVVPQAWLATLPRTATLVIAYDADAAGRTGRRKLNAAAIEQKIAVEHAEAPRGLDWNELLLRGSLSPAHAKNTLQVARRRGENTWKEEEWQRKLTEQTSPQSYYKIWSLRRAASVFEFQGSYWKGKKEKEDNVSVVRISDFTMHVVMAIQQDSRALEGGLYVYRLQPRNHNKRIRPVDLDGRTFTDSKRFAELMLGNRCHWSGDLKDLNQLIELIRPQDAPEARQIDVAGYDRESNCYIYPNLVVDATGKHYPLAADSILRTDKQAFVPNFPESERAYAAKGRLDFDALIQNLLQAYGPHALVVLGYFAASLFAGQFHKIHGYFPLLSLFGPPNTGKTDLLHLCNKLLARNVAEGLPISKVDTDKGAVRMISSLSNAPLAILEMNNERAVRFDLNRVLAMYNRESLQTYALRSMDNRYASRDLQATLIFVQNIERFSSSAQRSRVCSLEFPSIPVSEASLAAFAALKQTPPEALANFRRVLLQSRQEIEPQLARRQRAAAADFRELGVKMDRICQVHAVPLWGTEVMAEVLLSKERASEVSRAAEVYLLGRARWREETIHTGRGYLMLFLETLRDFLDRDIIKNHAPTKHSDEVWISLTEVRIALENDHSIIDLRASMDLLEDSPYLKGAKTKWSTLKHKSMHLHQIAAEAIYPGGRLCEMPGSLLPGAAHTNEEART